MPELPIELLIGLFMVIAGIAIGVFIAFGILKQRRKDDSNSN